MRTVRPREYLDIYIYVYPKTPFCLWHPLTCDVRYFIILYFMVDAYQDLTFAWCFLDIANHL